MLKKLWSYNEILSIVIITWLIAQFLKFVIIWIKNKKIDWKIFFKSGGMPSAHTAVVAALALALGILVGFNSFIFALGLVMAVIVIYDATGVRQAAGDHARVLNKIVPKILKEEEVHFKTRLGHKLSEVIAGVFLGLLVAGVSLWSRLNLPPVIKQFFTPSYLFNLNPGHQFAYLLPLSIIFGFFLVGGAILVFLARRLSNVVYKKFLSRVYNLLFTIGFVGFLLIFFRYENIYFLSARFWLIVLFITGAIWAIIIFYYGIKKLPQEVQRYQEMLRKEKYLPKQKR